MNANLYSIRQNRPNQFFAAGAAALTSTLVLGSVLWLFAGNVQAPSTNAAAMVQQHAAVRA